MSNDPQVASSTPSAPPDPVTATEASVSPSKTSDDAKLKLKKRRLGIDTSLIISDTRSKRRKTPTPEPEEEKKPEPDPKDPKRAKALGMQLYQKIMDSKDPNGEIMAEPFIKLPNKRQFPDYYQQIHKPISLEMVHEKLEQEAYQTLKEVCTDLGQICVNAKRYNVKQSLIFQFAKKIHKMIRTFYSNTITPGQKDESDSDGEHDLEPKTEPGSVSMEAKPSGDSRGDDEDGAGPSNHSAAGETASEAAIRRENKRRGNYMREGPTVYKLVKPVFKAIREAKARDGSGRDIAGIFMTLPDRKDFEDYYKVMKNPICLTEIEDRMLGRRYEKWEEFFEDVDLMINNAMIYNEDESEVYKDAEQIRDILEQNRVEVKDRSTKPVIPKMRLKASTVTPVRTGNLSGRNSISAEPHAGSPAYSHSPQSVPVSTPLPMMTPPVAPVPYLPALPPGVVTEDVVASLDRYPIYERQAWVNSLPPLAAQIYRQMAAALEARKRYTVPSTPPILADGPSSARRPPPPAERPPSNVSVENRAPPEPTIKYMDFTFASSSDEGDFRPTVRLHNLRGVVTHAVVVGSDTTEIELTAYISPPRKTDGDVTDVIESVPELSLRVNGSQGSLPRFVFAESDKERPRGSRWSVQMPAAKTDNRIEVIATKPGSMAETSTVLVLRQY
ncbi:hypothetical protein TREMEDRAFT_68376 [Tremella mesenterica DSM 1558]|uniref:uncharacterized protein n=1 Tax=Tremella mesenterica (strain ATCC 24925 / CBS 8224 / DSM 1558 / NBRC 9311 / NRRL Y-6157 / RJB 2259-6 / UBC 559-6) TaxID=578456 RepID=UPI0003F49B50|nr:uncharacterized protein TREMEDRAFT_68376 [Tremella mesenterica DSM 1558]EIW69929.1 hypothetical protein TREMEDRAFT_68376 [Tremella mesenterica DSM 1558]